MKQCQLPLELILKGGNSFDIAVIEIFIGGNFRYDLPDIHDSAIGNVTKIFTALYFCPFEVTVNTTLLLMCKASHVWLTMPCTLLFRGTIDLLTIVSIILKVDKHPDR